MEAAPFILMVPIPKSYMMGFLLYGCVKRALGPTHLTKLQTSHCNLLLWIIGFQCRQQTGNLLSCAEALKKAEYKSVEMAIYKRYLFYAGLVQRTTNA